MRHRIVIDADLTSEEMDQLRRTGFAVHKRGSKLRLEVGGNLMTQAKATVRIEEQADVESSSNVAKSTEKPGGQ